MTLAYACIAPHGGEIIPLLASRLAARKFLGKREGMREIARAINNSKPDTIVIASPHNLRLDSNIGIVTAENPTGSLKGDNGQSVSLTVRCDVEFARRLFRKARMRQLPVIAANYGTASGETSNMPMDWGTLVPLWFLLKHEKP